MLFMMKSMGRYGCMTKAMLDAWRSAWSVEPNTTPADFPFGIVVLASEEGDCGHGAFRWAQTGNNGVLPSNELPNTFAAQGFDAQVCPPSRIRPSVSQALPAPPLSGPRRRCKLAGGATRLSSSRRLR